MKTLKSIICMTLLCAFLLTVSILPTSAWGRALETLNVVEVNNEIHIILGFSKLPKSYCIDNSIPNQINISADKTKISRDLAKKLNKPINDEVEWEKENRDLSIVINHDGISEKATTKEIESLKQIIVTIPKKVIVIEPEPPKKPEKVYGFDDIMQCPLLKASTSDVNLSCTELAKGIKHLQVIKNIGRGPIFVNVIDIAPGLDNFDVIPALAAERINAKLTIRTLAEKNNAIAAINGGFFKPPTGHPLGTVIIDNELVTGPIFDRVTLGITNDNDYRLERVHLLGQLIMDNGKVIQIDNVNQPRMSKSFYLLYSYRWGFWSPEAPPGTKQILLVNNKVQKISAEPLMIPRNGYVIAGPDQGLFSQVRVGDTLKLVVSSDPDWSNVKHAMGGGPFLLKNGQVYVDIEDQKFSLKNVPEPRTAVGVTKNQHLLMVTVDGRQKDVSVGVTFYELAKIMKDLGAVEAMNLDGGSSTQMVVKGKIVNCPTVSGGNNVSNGLILVPKN